MIPTDSDTDRAILRDAAAPAAAPLGVRSAHPVAWFVATIGAALVLLVAVRWSGAVDPYVETTEASGSIPGETADPAVVRAFQQVEIRNRGFTTMELTRASYRDPTSPDALDHAAEVFLLDPGAGAGDPPFGGWGLGPPNGPATVGTPTHGLEPFRSVRIGPGQTRSVLLVVPTTCAGPRGSLRLELSSPLGRTRHVDRDLSAAAC